MFGPHNLYIICEPSQWNYKCNHNIVMKQSKGHTGDLKQEHKKTTNTTTMDQTTDIDSISHQLPVLAL